MKTIVITGVTSGIGKSLVIYFLSKGEYVIGISRNKEKLNQLQTEISLLGYSKFELFKADFSVLKEVESVGQDIRMQYPKGIDVLIHNAAVIPQNKIITKDFHEMQFQVNYLAAVKLTYWLLPLLEIKKGIVITTNSLIHKTARFDPKDLEGTKHYHLLRSYARTKLYNVLFARGMNEFVFPKFGVFTYTIDPGLVKTDIMEKYTNKFFRWALKIIKKASIPTPVIIVSGTIVEEKALELLKQGAIDYVMKDKHARLKDSIERAIKQTKEISKRQKMETALKESSELQKGIFDQSPIAIEIFDEKGFPKKLNSACLTLFGIYDHKQDFNFNLFDDPNITKILKAKLKNHEKINYIMDFDFENIKAKKLYKTS